MRQNRKNWSQEEDQTIMSLVRKFGTKRWTLISQKMKQRFPQDGRSGKQCRQRWHNHLSPIINKQPWTQAEIKIVFDAHRKFGNKWTQIAQLMQGRTDNAVKNQFYSTLRKGLRRICKILGTRNSTTRIKKIKPTALSNLITNFTQIPICQGQNNQQLYDMLFEFSNGDKYEQLKQKQVNEKYKQKMQRFLQKILDSKDNVKRRKNKSNIKQDNNQNIMSQQIPHIIINKPKKSVKDGVSGVNEKITKQSINCNQMKNQNQNLDENFNFNIDLDNQSEQEQFQFENEHEQEGNKKKQQTIQQQSQQIPFPLHTDEYDSRLNRPISLKKQNSINQSFKQQQQFSYALTLKKRSSQNEKIIKKHQQAEIQNNQLFIKNLFKKSPSYSYSNFRMRLPTPRANQVHSLFNVCGDDHCQQDAQKFYCGIIEEIKNKTGRGQKEKEKDKLR